MNAKTTSSQSWYNQRKWAAVSLVVLAVLTYVIASRAIYTGSLQQYGITLVLAALTIGRIRHIVHSRSAAATTREKNK